MNVTRETVVALLHRDGRHEDAERAQADLPELLHRARDVEFLERYGINPADLVDDVFENRPHDLEREATLARKGRKS